MKKKAIKRIDNNIETFKNSIIEQTIKHIQKVQNKKRKITVIKEIKERIINKILINKANKIKLTNNFNIIHSSINTIFLLLLNYILFAFINPILTQKDFNNNRKLTTGSHIELKVWGGYKIKIINDIYIPDRVYINGIESPIDIYGRITTEDDAIYNVTLLWDEKITNFEGLFEDINYISEIDLSYLDTSGITSMESMFKYCEQVQYINFSNINTSSVITMKSMFEGCYGLVSLDLLNFDTRNVKYMDSMFKGCYLIESLDLSNFETPNLIEIREIFSDCHNLKMIDISNIVTSLITDMSFVFYSCFSLTSIDINHFDTSNVIDRNSLFYFCISLE
jgi:surface protein